MKKMDNDLKVLQIKFVDLQIANNTKELLTKASAGCFVEYGGKLVDILIIKQERASGQQSADTLTIPLSSDHSKEDPHLKLVVKDILNSQSFVGNITLFR